MLWIPLLISVLTLIYFYMWWLGGYWVRKNIPCLPATDIFGHIWTSMSLKEAFGIQIDKLYKRFRHAPYFGSYAFFKPGLVLVDLDMVKTVLATEFNSFQQNDFDIDNELEPLFATNPFVQSGAEWKNSRTQITPAFTSGRMKAMFPLMLEVCKKMTTYIEKNKDSTSYTGIETKSLSEMFAMDNVASCAFGIDAESFINPNSEFIRFGKKIFETSFINTIKISIALMAPWLSKLLRVRFIPKDTSDWMQAVVTDNVKYREKHNIFRDDFLQCMMNLRDKHQGNGLPMSDLVMTGHSLSFLTDGYETSSGVLAFALFVVANDEQLQEDLRRQIKQSIEKHGGNITYEAVMDISLLERILFETMRLYVPLMVMQKRCTQVCTLPGKVLGSVDITMKPGDCVMIPAYSIHMDPEHYPEPEKFDPGRWTEEEKTSRHSYAFLGFGGGPRQCIGMRFAMLQMKVAVFHAVENFKLSVSSKTKLPITPDEKSFLYKAKGGLWVNFEKL